MAKRFQHEWGYMGTDKSKKNRGDLLQCQVTTCKKWSWMGNKPLFKMSQKEYEKMHESGKIDATEILGERKPIKKSKIIAIQPKENQNGVLPYPYFIDKDAYVGRQDYWQGSPYKLLGFSKKPIAGAINLEFKDFWKKPTSCIGMFAVFSTAQDSWSTQTIPIESVNIT